ncbi:HEAT repeat domain-containing protein [Streptomyces sp. NPDC002680]|uniref:HEAT repeat domain-containing protein n=1 Tax=Streptomyces sp. NPDC002680 TaxID=3364659 RepID=UPI0036C4CADD
MFTGIDDVDWASMRHAYGSAEDVPGLLRGLASADPGERESALDGMYGSVHHQGAVYDSTLACVPFLLALVAREEVRDRGGIVELLMSIGEAGGARSAQAGAAVRAGAEVFVELVGDRDTGVRRAAPTALVRFLDEPARVLAVLRQRITVERNDGVLLALAESLGLFTRLHDGHGTEAVGQLVTLSAPPFDPGLRLAALGQLALTGPEHRPADLVPTVVALLRERSARRTGRAQCSDFLAEDTLTSHLRRLRPSDEEGSQLLRTFHLALDDRVDDRIALLNGQLNSPAPTDRCNAVWMSAGLFREWRADYTGPVALIGRQLGADEDRLREAASAVLEELYTLAAPAADDLFALVAARPEVRIRVRERGASTVGRPLNALARTGDPRAIPVLAELLGDPAAPDGLGHTVGHLGRAAASLAPALRDRLASVRLDLPDAYDRAVPLLSALAAVGDGGAAPEVLRLLRGIPTGSGLNERQRGWLTERALETLGAFGAAARDSVPVLRGLLDSAYAVRAADALWSVEGDVDAVLPVLLRELTGEQWRRRAAAAEVLARLGPAGRAAVPGLLRLCESEEVWERTRAACALWRITGDAAQVVVPVLRSAWTRNRYTRGTIAACLLAMGSAAAPLRDLPRTELTTRRRHRARPGGFSAQDVLEDERLLRACEELL